ncbi:TonB-dependent receptor plug domain-containing protein [Gloeocapsopsis sp. IPPAS B-1203]|uniref:TonB-dependent receptor plug domain-containing protein n=1 Tax=Gloeocapsopsis sp. IPPAS B-1203 TaxID=2049454 RepID=UPI0025A298A3|nr:TonB-dependent receptor plug domain-containing protein [Gloeocapsopsis sp. IPPAS B-1203]
MEQPALTVEEWASWLAHSSTAVQITGVQLNSTDSGIEIILDSTGELEQPSTSAVGNALIVDIPNAVLNLPDGEEFQATNPSEDIALVSITPLPGNWVRIAITGLNSPPVAEVRQAEPGLIVSLSPGTEVSEEDNDAIQVVVTGEQESGYAADNATTATRTDTPLRDIPQSIQVIPKQVLVDQQVIQLRDAVRNISGVVEANTFGNTRDTFIIRGFEQGVILQDGLRGFRNNTQSSFIESANVERIEVLKGPASVLYGTLEPGGVINVITEQPLEFPFYSIELQGGNFGLIRPSIDLSGSLNPDGTLLYRLNAVYENGNSFRDFDQNIERIFVSPVVAWRISDRTDFALNFEYLNDTRPFDRGILAFGTGIADIPYDRVLGEPDDRITAEGFSASYRLEHRFSDNWSLRNAFRFSSTNGGYRAVEPDNLDENTGILARTWTDSESHIESYSLQTTLAGEFRTGSVGHTLLFGVDLNRDTNVYNNYFDFGGAPSINIFDPVYGLASFPDREDLQDRFFLNTRTDCNSNSVPPCSSRIDCTCSPKTALS